MSTGGTADELLPVLYSVLLLTTVANLWQCYKFTVRQRLGTTSGWFNATPHHLFSRQDERMVIIPMRSMKIVALPDLHVPENIDLRPIWKFIYDFKPDVVVLPGDVHDWTPVSIWIANQSLQLEGKSVKKCYDEIRNVVLEPLREATQRKAEVKYLRGNHEAWVDMVIDLNRNGRGYWELENNLDIKRYNLEFFPVNGVWRPCNNLTYLHGIYLNEFHAKKTVQAYHTSVLYGHTHDVQVYVQVSPVDSEHFYKGASMGCLCNLNPHYMKNKPSRWVHGFNYAYISEDTGHFNDTQVLIVQGGFWAGGKYYS